MYCAAGQRRRSHQLYCSEQAAASGKRLQSLGLGNWLSSASLREPECTIPSLQHFAVTNVHQASALPDPPASQADAVMVHRVAVAGVTSASIGEHVGRALVKRDEFDVLLLVRSAALVSHQTAVRMLHGLTLHPRHAATTCRCLQAHAVPSANA